MESSVLKPKDIMEMTAEELAEAASKFREERARARKLQYRLVQKEWYRRKRRGGSGSVSASSHSLPLKGKCTTKQNKRRSPKQRSAEPVESTAADLTCADISASNFHGCHEEPQPQVGEEYSQLLDRVKATFEAAELAAARENLEAAARNTRKDWE